MTGQEIYTMFKTKQGSEAISGVATLDAVISFLKKNNFQTILELGGGIGTISYVLLSNSDASIDIYEPNEFCQKALRENLTGMGGRYSILPSYDILPPRRNYDLIVVDGGKGTGNQSIGIADYGYPQLIAAYIASLQSIKTIFVEGQRKSQKFWILEALRTRFIYTPYKFFDPAGGKKIGVQIDCRPSSNELLKIINHFLQRKKVY